MPRYVILTVVSVFLFGTAAGAAPPVTAAAFAPDGQRVVLGSQAGIEFNTWPELKSGSRLKTELSHVHDLAFSPDGQTLLAAGGSPAKTGSVEMWTGADGKLLRRVTEHKDLVYRVAWSPDGSRWATASADTTCAVFATETGKPVARFEGHSRAALALAFLPDGKTVVSVGVDQTLQVWEASSGKLVRALDNHTGAVNDVAVRPASPADAAPIVATVGEDRTVRLWQPTKGRLLRFTRLDSVPRAVTWSATGDQLLAACDDGRLRVIDFETLNVVSEKQGLDGRVHVLVRHPKADREVLLGGDGVTKRGW
jgi:WD40 repeat protein